MFLRDKHLKCKCCGCEACEFVCEPHALQMETDEEGFSYPILSEEKCTKCNYCTTVCPLESVPNKVDEELQGILAVRLNDKEKLMQSQSGGAFTALAEVAFAEVAIVYGVALIDREAVYIRCESLEQLPPVKGSKYVQAELRDTYKQIKSDLQKGLTVLFVGTPCYVHGLFSWLDFLKVDTSRLCGVDLVCFGVASPLIVKEYLQYLDRHYKVRISEYNYRDKAFGWKGSYESFRVNGKLEFRRSLLAKLYNDRLSIRPSCYFCNYTSFDRVSDITIGDFWGIEKIHPELDDNKGVSLVMVNTSKGREWFEKIKDNLTIEVSNREDCAQPRLKSPSMLPKVRALFWNDYRNNSFDALIEKYAYDSFAKRVVGFFLRLLSK